MSKQSEFEGLKSSSLVESCEKSIESKKKTSLVQSCEKSIEHISLQTPVQQKEVSQDVISITEEFEDKDDEKDVHLEFPINDQNSEQDENSIESPLRNPNLQRPYAKKTMKVQWVNNDSYSSDSDNSEVGSFENNQSKKNRRILVVDDEPYNIMGLKIIIEACDKEHQLVNLIIDQATNGMEAYKAVKMATESKSYEYGLIFMDCSMPILDGYEASDRIRLYLRNHYEQQPMIVACTGHTEIEYIKKAWRYQMDEVVPKPANLQVIKCILDEMILYKEN